MGCVQSRKDITDIHPNIFRVVNIDECGNGLWPGQIEVTDMELVLYRRGRDPTKWPLQSLRRYGFDGDIFSFESGRRCPTGQGIYAFRCRRAEQLFTTLQQYIHVRNLSSEVTNANISSNLSTGPVTTLRPLLPVQQVQLVDSLPSEQLPNIIMNDIHNSESADYLEPVQATSADRNRSRFSGTIRLNSLSIGPISPDINSPGSPSSANILEVMPLNPLPESNHVSNLYQLQEFPLREHNNNRKILSGHSYTNTSDIHNDLVTLRSTLQAQQNAAINEELEDLHMIQTSIRKSTSTPLSPELSNTSEHYATLMEQEPLRLYMNLLTRQHTTASSPDHVNNQNSQSQEFFSKNDYVNDLSCVDACKMIDREEARHSYANLGVNEVHYDPKMLGRQISSSSKCFVFVDANLHQTSTVEIPKQMNYAVLDLQASRERSDDALNAMQTLPPESPKKAGIGYTTIDFNKTVALKSMTMCTETDTEGSRRTRHNSTTLPMPGSSGV